MAATSWLIGSAFVLAQPTTAALPQALALEYAKARTAHLTNDAALLVSIHDDDFVSIDAGKVTRPSRQDRQAMFERYFGAVAFRAWDDVAPPIVTLSADRTMATIAVQKIVRLVARTRSTEADAPVSESRFA